MKFDSQITQSKIIPFDWFTPFIYFGLTLVRFTFIPDWPINFIPVISLIWQNHKHSKFWYLLLFGLINDIFATDVRFGLTSLIFIAFGATAEALDRFGRRTIINFAATALLLALASGFSWSSAILIPAGLVIGLFNQYNSPKDL